MSDAPLTQVDNIVGQSQADAQSAVDVAIDLQGYIATNYPNDAALRQKVDDTQVACVTVQQDILSLTTLSVQPPHRVGKG
jgi:hypothetical protein